MKKLLLLFLFNLTIFANDYAFDVLEKKKSSLINSYFKKIEKAVNDKLIQRALFLEKTLVCFHNSRSSRELTLCKIDERRRIMEMIKG
uniref:hypothetical protein n=1 Tax=Aliarcobacter sp. TaxID=2321116 RepID=UPI004047559E